jgi:hypothetical protein
VKPPWCVEVGVGGLILDPEEIEKNEFPLVYGYHLIIKIKHRHCRAEGLHMKENSEV